MTDPWVYIAIGAAALVIGVLLIKVSRLPSSGGGAGRGSRPDQRNK